MIEIIKYISLVISFWYGCYVIFAIIALIKNQTPRLQNVYFPFAIGLSTFIYLQWLVP